MGLDMYLEREHFIGGNYSHRRVSGVINVNIEGGDRVFSIDPTRVSTISEHVGYWRKANQIHNFFVSEVQDGRDECQRSLVDSTTLIKLRSICEEIISAKEKFGANADETLGLINDKLPTKAGFFFGSTFIDEYYFQDLEDTIRILENVTEDDDGSYYYQASW